MAIPSCEKRILVAGSCKHLNSEREKTTFREQCEELGRRLAKSGTTIIVGSTHEPTADRHILEGANKVALGSKLRVIASSAPVHDGPTFADLQEKLPNLEFSIQQWNAGWHQIRNRQVEPSDLVVLIGGSKGTRDVATIAQQLKKPVLALGAAGGTAADVFDWFSKDLSERGVSDDELDVLRNAFDAELVLDLIKRLLTASPTNHSNRQKPQGANKETAAMARTFSYVAFISYRRQEPDKTFARDLLRRLEASGLKAAIDERDFDPAATFLEEMERCIKQSRFTLVVASPSYFKSGNCEEEAIICKVLDMAERRRRTIPLIIESVTMPVWLYNIVGINFTDADPLVNPHDKLIAKLRTPLTGSSDAGAMPVSQIQNAPQSTGVAGRATTVLFDEAHGQASWFGLRPTVDRGFSRIKATTEQHLAVRTLADGQKLATATLQGHRALILAIGPEGKTRLLDEEITAVHNFVRGGGGLLVLGTYTGDWHHEANLNQLIQEYGISFGLDVVTTTADDGWRQGREKLPDSDCAVKAFCAPSETHQAAAGTQTALLKGVSTIITLSSCTLVFNSDLATPILCSAADSVILEPEPTGIGVQIQKYQRKRQAAAVILAASKNHRVVVAGSWKMFLDAFIDHTSYQNGQLHQNILDWLTWKE